MKQTSIDRGDQSCALYLTSLLYGVFSTTVSPWILQPQTLSWSPSLLFPAPVRESASFSSFLGLLFCCPSCFQCLQENTQLSVLALTSILRLGSKYSALPFASLSASLFPSRGAHSTTVRSLIFLMYDASSMSTTDAKIRRSSACLEEHRSHGCP